MTRLTIERLALRAFKGAELVELELNGQSATIRGDNATGKTTLHDAWTWLLFGKDASGAATFAIKTLDADGSPRSGLEHTVSARLVLDGRPIELEKTYTEKWTKRRGSSAAELTGHETRHHVDGVPVSAREYDERVAAIAPPELFRLLSDPLHFSEGMAWRDRRDLLLEIFGDVTDAELVAAHPDLEELGRELERFGRSLDDHRRVLDEQRKRLNRDRSALPIRIDEATRTIEGAPELEAAHAELEAATAELELAEAELRAARAADPAESIADDRRRLTRELAELAKARAAADRRARDAHLERLGAADRAAATAKEAHAHTERRLEALGRSAVLRQTQVERLRTAFAKVRAEDPPAMPEGADVCAGCGRPLPAEQVDAARQAVREAWLAERAERLERIRAEGKAEAAELEAIERQIVALEPELERELADLEVKATRAAEIRALQVEPVAPSDEELELEQRLAAIDSAEAAPASVPAEVAQGASIAQDRQGAARRALAQAEAAENARARVDDLRLEEKRLAGELERCDRQIDLAERWLRYKVGALQDRINGHFELAAFRLFADQINGGIAEICETTHAGVPWSSLNRGARMNVGLEIVDVLAEHYGFAPPVWIDNAEAVTRVRPTEAQRIRLVVDRDHADLELELDKETNP